MPTQRFLVIEDYQSGGFGLIVYAPNEEALKNAVRADELRRGISIISEGIDEHPLVKFYGDKIEICYLDDPQGLLKVMIKSAKVRLR